MNVKMRTQPIDTRGVALALACGLLLGAGGARADELRIENVKVAPRDAATATVTFDVAWSNSWRHGDYHDAAWVFFKVQADKESDWQHVHLVADKVVNPTGYEHGKGTPIESAVPLGDEEAVGMFVRRAEEGKSGVEARGVTAVWDFTANDGVRQDMKDVRMQAFAVEMAYVPRGPFYLGSGNDTGKQRNAFHMVAGDGLPPYLVTSAGAIPTGRQKGKLWARGITPEDDGEIPASFPNGYAAFYCMKFYYFTQAQYAGFLNTITAEQAKNRWYTDYQGVAVKRSGEFPNYDYAASGPTGKCPWLSWTDNATIAAWAGLRPMTELEFEKSVHGPQKPNPAWDAAPSFCGLTDINTGGIYERMISVGKEEGRKFAGTHGRGTPVLPADWPADSGCAVYRGQYPWLRYYGPPHTQTTGRLNALSVHSDRRFHPFAGWRGVRSAPDGDPIAQQATDRFNAATVRSVARLARPARADGVLEEWGEPLATISDPTNLFPIQYRFAPFDYYGIRQPWQGPGDLSAKVFLGCDGKALCVAAEVTDDRHFNTQTTDGIWKGDSLKMGLITADDVRWDMGLALTKSGIVFHQWEGKGDALAKTVGCGVVRDNKTGVTRYELRLPLAVLNMKPGDEFGFNIAFSDDDDGEFQRFWLQLAPGLTAPVDTEQYPRFVLEGK